MSRLDGHKYPTLTHLGELSVEEFLRDYWQKKPCIIRQALPNFESPLTADELAGFCLDTDVSSRLVQQITERQWQLDFGPLDAEVFHTLPSTNWTLLIDRIDSLDPHVNALVNAFRFIPNWRLDDIMVSYAVDKGGVGPHFDYYDVFLLQGSGKREWKIGQRCDSATSLIPDQPMKIMRNFETQACHILEAGDLLYLPAQIAHWGEAIGESITYSIGFRAPSHGDILLEFAQAIASDSLEEKRFKDSGILQSHHGEIPTHVIQTLIGIVNEYSNDDTRIAQWFGEYSTQLKQEIPNTENEVVKTDLPLKNASQMQLSCFCRSAYYSLSNQSDRVLCFINGETFRCSSNFAKRLTAYAVFSPDILTLEDYALLEQLISKHWIVFANEY